MSERTSEVCLRCGDFLERAARPFEGVALCRACFEPRSIRPDPFVCWPPWRFLTALTAVVFAIGVLGLIVGTIVAHLARSDLLFGAGAGGVLALLAIMLPPVFELVDRIQDRYWRRAVIADLGLAGESVEALPFVFWKTRRRGWLEPGAPDDVGLLIETPEALAIIGARGERPIVRVADVTALVLERASLATWVPLAVRLELRGGKTLWIAVRSLSTFRENRRLTRELEARLRARIAPPPTPSA